MVTYCNRTSVFFKYLSVVFKVKTHAMFVTYIMLFIIMNVIMRFNFVKCMIKMVVFNVTKVMLYNSFNVIKSLQTVFLRILTLA